MIPTQEYLPTATRALSFARETSRTAGRRWTVLLAMLLAMLTSAAHAETRDLSILPAIKAHAGKVVLLDFWASWCAPCRQSFPWMSELQKRYGRDKLVVLAVNMDQDKALATRFLEKTPAGFEVLYDPKGDLATQLNVQAMPTSYLIDPKGRQRAVHKGFRDAQRAEREKQIEQLINEGKS